MSAQYMASKIATKAALKFLKDYEKQIELKSIWVQTNEPFMAARDELHLDDGYDSYTSNFLRLPVVEEDKISTIPDWSHLVESTSAHTKELGFSLKIAETHPTWVPFPPYGCNWSQTLCDELIIYHNPFGIDFSGCPNMIDDFCWHIKPDHSEELIPPNFGTLFKGGDRLEARLDLEAFINMWTPQTKTYQLVVPNEVLPADSLFELTENSDEEEESEAEEMDLE